MRGRVLLPHAGVSSATGLGNPDIGKGGLRFTQQHQREGTDLDGHHAAHHRGIAFGKGAGGLDIAGLKDHQAEGLVAWLQGASDDDGLALPVAVLRCRKWRPTISSSALVQPLS